MDAEACGGCDPGPRPWFATSPVGLGAPRAGGVASTLQTSLGRLAHPNAEGARAENPSERTRCAEVPMPKTWGPRTASLLDAAETPRCPMNVRAQVINRHTYEQLTRPETNIQTSPLGRSTPASNTNLGDRFLNQHPPATRAQSIPLLLFFTHEPR